MVDRVKILLFMSSIALMAGSSAHAATDNGFGDDLAKTGYFTVASYKAFGPDTPDVDLVARAQTVDPSSLNAIVPASGDASRPAASEPARH